MTPQEAVAILKSLGSDSKYYEEDPDKSWTTGNWMILTKSGRGFKRIERSLKDSKIPYEIKKSRISNQIWFRFPTQSAFVRTCNRNFKSPQWAKTKHKKTSRIIGEDMEVWTENNPEARTVCLGDFLIMKAQTLMKEQKITEHEADGIVITDSLF